MALPHAEAVLVPPVPAMPATDGACVNEMHQLDARGTSDRMADPYVTWLQHWQRWQAHAALAHCRQWRFPSHGQLTDARRAQEQETLSTDLFGADMLRTAVREQVAFMSCTESATGPTRRSRDKAGNVLFPRPCLRVSPLRARCPSCQPLSMLCMAPQHARNPPQMRAFDSTEPLGFATLAGSDAERPDYIFDDGARDLHRRMVGRRGTMRVRASHARGAVDLAAQSLT